MTDINAEVSWVVLSKYAASELENVLKSVVRVFGVCTDRAGSRLEIGTTLRSWAVKLLDRRPRGVA